MAPATATAPSTTARRPCPCRRRHRRIRVVRLARRLPRPRAVVLPKHSSVVVDRTSSAGTAAGVTRAAERSASSVANVSPRASQRRPSRRVPSPPQRQAEPVPAWLPAQAALPRPQAQAAGPTSRSSVSGRASSSPYCWWPLSPPRFLGGLGPTATPTHAANLSPTPTSGASASGASPSGSGAVSSPTASASAGLPTDTPTASAPGPTDTPAIPTSGPTATPRPTRTPRPTSNATPAPADARCTNVGNRGRFTTGFVPGSSRTLDAHTAWCVKSVTFAKGNGSGTLKIFLVNDAFDVSPYGWAEVQQPDGFGGSDTYKWDFSIGLPQGYDNIPPNTEIQFQTHEPRFRQRLHHLRCGARSIAAASGGSRSGLALQMGYPSRMAE